LQSIVLDAGKGEYYIQEDELGNKISYMDKGVENKGLSIIEYKLTRNAADTIEQALRAKMQQIVVKKIVENNEEFTFEKRLQRISTSDSIVLSLHLYKAALPENKITLFVIKDKQEEQNQKFACYLARELESKITGLSKQIEIKYLENNDENFRILEKNGENIGVLLELGNINHDENPLQSQQLATAEAITAAIEKYDKDR